jgi:signal transduction histidine kinase
VYESLSKNKTEPYELDLYRYNKKTFPALASGKNIIRNEKTYRIVTIVDLTHIKQKDKLIQEQSKLAQMGEMLSMIAHQWRQPLSSISATSEAIRLKATLGQIDTPMLLELSKKITTYTTHLNNTIDDFRDFYKKDKIKELTTLDKLCNKSLNIIEGTIKNNKITLLKEYNSHTLINIYSNELTQVILSLLQNGVDKLTDKDYENPTITIKTFEDNKFLYLDISDNGNKIEDTILNKIFEPYFSTKLKQNGTGLGLYMAKRIIEENCNGNLYVNNKENQVTFTIKLLKV